MQRSFVFYDFVKTERFFFWFDDFKDLPFRFNNASSRARDKKKICNVFLILVIPEFEFS